MTDIEPDSPKPAGTSRRDLLKRGAVVGGTLVWATPVVQSLGGKAFAATPGSEAPSQTKESATLTVDGTPGIPGNLDAPRLTITNTSAAIGTLLTAFSLTIGDTTYNFDRVINELNSAAVGATLTAPDTVNDHVRSNTLSFSFTSFAGLGDSFSFNTELDQDRPPASSANNLVDFRKVFFSATPAVASFTFSTGPTLTVTLPTSAPPGTVFAFSVSA